MSRKHFEAFYCPCRPNSKSLRGRVLVVLGEKPKNQKESGYSEVGNLSVLEVVQAGVPG